MTSSSSSSSSSSFLGWKYHVFISFRGADTRLGFAGYLNDALCSSGIETFFYDEKLQKGAEINTTLDEAIRGSRIGLVIFSKNYASSTWCLEELAKIMEYSKDEAKPMLIMPIFYRINPSDLRYHKGSYADALATHESRFKEKWKIEKWRSALNKAADLSGWHLGPDDKMYEHKFTKEIVKSISKMVSSLLENDQKIAQHNKSHPVLQSQQRQPSFEPAGHATPSSNDGISISQSQQPQYYYSQPMQQPKSSLLQTNHVAPSSPLKHGFMRRAGMHIFVRRFDGNNFMLEVVWFDTVHDVKAMIMAKIGIPIHQQRIIYEGKDLEDGCTLADYNMKNESTVHLILRNPTQGQPFGPEGHATPSNDGIPISQSHQPQYYYSQPMQQPKPSLLQTNYAAPSSPLKHGFMRRDGMHISVHRFDGNEFMLEVARFDTVHDVKAMIMAKIGIPVHQQLIIYQGKNLEDGCTLGDYNMKNESTVHLILRNPTVDKNIKLYC